MFEVLRRTFDNPAPPQTHDNRMYQRVGIANGDVAQTVHHRQNEALEAATERSYEPQNVQQEIIF